jgi:hypothetical protein
MSVWPSSVRLGVCITIAAVLGVAAVYLLPADWLGPLSAAGAIGAAVLVVIVRFGTWMQEPSFPSGIGLLLSMLNLPEQPLAKVRQGWALDAFLTLAAFLVALGLAVVVRASG